MRFWNRTDQTSDTLTNWDTLQNLKTKGGLLDILQMEAVKYTSDDLDIMMINYDEKIKNIPAEYRAELQKYARIQITEGYNRLSTEKLDRICRKEKLSPLWKEYISFVKTEIMTGNRRLRSLKYLIAAYTIFIDEKPPHPAGTPFPGGGSVEIYEGSYFCPVKDAWKSDKTALCRFCPAQQSKERDMKLSQSERKLISDREKISNYFYNFKG